MASIRNLMAIAAAMTVASVNAFDGTFDTAWANLSRVGYVSGLAFAGDKEFYAYGDFDTIGNVPVNHIAKWTPRGWRIFPSRKTWKRVAATAVDKQGNALVAGRCDTTGSGDAGCLAAWKNTDWQLIPLGASGNVSVMIKDKGGDIYVGGTFDKIGSVAARSIAKWDGATWSPLGGGVDSGVCAVGFDKTGALYAVSKTTTTFYGDAIKVAKWNGSWSPVTEGFLKELHGVAVGPSGEVYMAGISSGGAGARPDVFSKYAGGQWRTLVTDFDFQESPTSLWVDSNGTLWDIGDVHAVPGTWAEGWCTGATWDGSTWTRCTLPRGTHSLASGPFGEKIASGNYGAFVSSGSDWETPGGPDPYRGADHVALDGSGKVYLAGDSLVEVWDGMHSRLLGSGLPGEVFALAVSPKGEVFASGQTRNYDGYVCKWDGKAWIPIGDFQGQGKIDFMRMDKNGKVYIIQSIYAMRWDDTAWTNLGTAYLSGRSTSVFFDPQGRVYKTDDGKMLVRNDTGWVVPDFWTHAAPNDVPLDGFFDAAGNAYVIVAGPWLTYPDRGAFTLMKWDGAAFTKLGIFTSSPFTAVCASHVFDSKGNLYIAGMFGDIETSQPPFLTVNNIAKWDGTSWTPLGIGTEPWGWNYEVLGAAIDSADNIHVVGRFKKAGGMICPSYSIYNGNSALSQVPLGAARAPGPAQKPRAFASGGSLRLQDVLPHDRILVYTLKGRRLLEISGAEKNRWADLAGQPLIVRITRDNAVVFSGMVMELRP